MKNSIADAHYKTHVLARWKMVLATIAMALHAACIVMMVQFLIKYETPLLDASILALNVYAFVIAHRYRRKQEGIALASLQRYRAYQHEVPM